MCLNKRVLIGLGIVAVGVLLLRPSWLGAALPLLLLAVCPLSMLFMMKGMNGGQGGSSGKDGNGANNSPDRPAETPERDAVAGNQFLPR